jgi:hypothetical protein
MEDKVIFSKMEDKVIFSKIETTSIFSGMAIYLNFSKNKRQRQSLANGR